MQQSNSSKRYFDINRFIKTNALQLNKAHAGVNKTVVHNNTGTQTRQMAVNNWQQELELFAASDMNKPAWKDSYSIDKQGDSITYTATDPHLVTRRMIVQTLNKQVIKISINNYTKNLLYETTEHLVYYPDSLYIIDKLQKVKLIGSNRYIITGKIN